jgi:putative restriction endonuclease
LFSVDQVFIFLLYYFCCQKHSFNNIRFWTTALDAAHIHQFKKGGSNHPRNGIALSKTAHWLFDCGFWSITDDLRVLVATDRFDEAGEEAYLLKKLAGRELLRPANSHFLPDPSYSAWHRTHHGFEAVSAHVALAERES